MATPGKPMNSAQAELLSAVEGFRSPMVALTQELVSIRTENPPGNCYGEAAELILHHLQQLGLNDTEVHGDCVVGFAGSGENTLYFSGHYDVVPAQNPTQFEPQIKGENLFGRGSSDMKSGLAAIIYAAKALQESALLRKGRIGLVFVPDEETAGPRGSRFLAQKGILGRNAIGMLTPEPTGGLVWNASRGAITLRVSIKGKPAHVGRQHEGVNAFEKMMSVVQSLLALKHEVENRVTAFHITPEAARRSILMIGGRCECGTNFNVVPDIAWFTIDRRINPEERLEEERRRLNAVLDQARSQGIDLTIETLQEAESSGTQPGTRLEQSLKQSIHMLTGQSPQIEMCPGLLETRFYAAAGIPAFAYGPGLLAVSHGPKEFVPLDRIVQCASVYALTAAELLADSS
jgi:acetylornithine deacetylase/succinyl-diaminopimelate desuccinylase family protein